MKERDYTEPIKTLDEVLNEPQHVIKNTVYQLGCNGCHQTNVTLIKCTDSYYCPKCMKELGKTKFKKGNK